jgi:uncharacterized protein
MNINEPRPIAAPDHVTQLWWDATREHRLLIQRCAPCAHHQLYPRNICTSCGALDPDYVEASGRGTIYSFTQVQRAPHPAFNAPYVVAMVRLEEGPVVLSNIVGDGELACDAAVRVVWEDLEDGRSLPLFTLA